MEEVRKMNKFLALLRANISEQINSLEEKREGRGSVYVCKMNIYPDIFFNAGIQTIETAKTRIHCFESKTSVKFLLITDYRVPNLARDALRKIHEHYCDFVLKDPFYKHNQPIQSDLFSRQVKLVCEHIERGNLSAV